MREQTGSTVSSKRSANIRLGLLLPLSKNAGDGVKAHEPARSR